MSWQSWQYILLVLCSTLCLPRKIMAGSRVGYRNSWPATRSSWVGTVGLSNSLPKTPEEAASDFTEYAVASNAETCGGLGLGASPSLIGSRFQDVDPIVAAARLCSRTATACQLLRSIRSFLASVCRQEIFKSGSSPRYERLSRRSSRCACTPVTA
jgi:hypothetical protein